MEQVCDLLPSKFLIILLFNCIIYIFCLLIKIFLSLQCSLAHILQDIFKLGPLWITLQSAWPITHLFFVLIGTSYSPQTNNISNLHFYIIYTIELTLNSKCIKLVGLTPNMHLQPSPLEQLDKLEIKPNSGPPWLVHLIYRPSSFFRPRNFVV